MQRIKNLLLTLLVAMVAVQFSAAYIPVGTHGTPAPKSGAPKANYREECAQSKSQIDLNVNNVRARLQGGGDIWWDFKDGLYVVPNVAPGVPRVSSIFAGGIWIGGIDAGNNLKTACTLFRRAADNDWWSGPLDEKGGVEAATCANWDKHFVVNGGEIDAFKTAYDAAPKDAGGRVLDPGFIDQIEQNVKGWPSKGNPYFTEVHGFPMPANVKKFAYFWDRNEDGKYDPLDGDYPAIFVRGCEKTPQYADQMIFWIFNDAGGVHTQSNGQPIRMEVQVQAFAYATNDEVNNMSFMAYRLANRAAQDIDSMFFAVWTDPDLGCYTDDYIGCDNSIDASGKPRSLMYVYNEDAVDGSSGSNCGDVNTYASKIPILGVDYFRGPLDLAKPLIWDPKLKDSVNVELGMSTFMYFNGATAGSPPPATQDPTTVEDHYQYLNAVWRDKTPLSIGGNGYNANPDASKLTKYAFLDEPQNPTGWSMTTAGVPFGDRRTLQVSGPFKLLPGAINELIVGVPWVADQGGGKVSLTALRKADDKAQGLFDSCFDILDGPDAPEVGLIELDKELVIVLTNDAGSNNHDESYGADLRFREKQPESPTTGASPYYNFEGYKVYQLAGPEAGVSDIEDPEKSKLVALVDVKNNVVKQFNWENTDDPNNPSNPAVYPILRSENTNKGVEHTFRVKQDLFAKGQSKSLINHKKYYFVAIAFAHNEYEKYDKKIDKGQKTTYIVGRRNIEITTAIPRPIVDKKLNASYGDGVVVTRFDGIGTGGNNLDISEDTRVAILNKTFKGEIKYKAGRAPINVKVYNPLEVKNGKFELTFFDGNMTNDVLDAPTKWKLKNLADGTEVISETSIDRLNEQIIAKYGFSIGIGQVKELGELKSGDNGMIGGEIEYKNPSGGQWFSAINDEYSIPGFGGSQFFDFVLNNAQEELFEYDRDQALSTKVLKGQFVPYTMCDYKRRSFGTGTTAQTIPYTTPAWYNNLSKNYYLNAGGAATKPINTFLEKIPNVDIVLTSDKSKWSRCVVVETINDMYTESGMAAETDPANPAKAKGSFDLRAGASIGSETDPNAASDGTKGKSWFPGYAVDVETGKRYNVFFGENSGFDSKDEVLNEVYKFSQPLTGRDMIWNPTTDAAVGNGPQGAAQLVAGCGHYIYVTDQEYDGCADLYTQLNKTSPSKTNVVRRIRWTAMPFLTQGSKMLDYKSGLIPNDCTIKLRVDNPYSVSAGTNVKLGYPTYQFEIANAQAGAVDSPELVNKALEAINVVPNPYYAYSAYEISQFTNTVKITNLPAKCVVSIYTLDGKFIRQYRRDEVAERTKGTNPGVSEKQITPALEWDLKNEKSIPVASGTYLIHVSSDLGERTLKFFGVMRPFDPSGL